MGTGNGGIERKKNTKTHRHGQNCGDCRGKGEWGEMGEDMRRINADNGDLR